MQPVSTYYSTSNPGNEIPLEDTRLLPDSQGLSDGRVYDKITETDEPAYCTMRKCCASACLLTTAGCLLIGSSVLVTTVYMNIFRLLDPNINGRNLMITGTVCGVMTVVLGVGLIGVCACVISGNNENSTVQAH